MEIILVLFASHAFIPGSESPHRKWKVRRAKVPWMEHLFPGTMFPMELFCCLELLLAKNKYWKEHPFLGNFA